MASAITFGSGTKTKAPAGTWAGCSMEQPRWLRPARVGSSSTKNRTCCATRDQSHVAAMEDPKRPKHSLVAASASAASVTLFSQDTWATTDSPSTEETSAHGKVRGADPD